MSGLRVEWSGNMPAEVRAAVETVLTRWLHLVPPQWESLRIEYCADREYTAQCETSNRYRWAVIRFSGLFFERDPLERERTVVHELLHVTATPLQRAWEVLGTEIVNRIPGAPDGLGAYVQANYEEALEQVMTDLARSLVAGTEV